jgi:hypothetical protein
MRLLVLGGTKNLGRHVAETAWSRAPSPALAWGQVMCLRVVDLDVEIKR